MRRPRWRRSTGDTQGVRIIDRMNWTGLGFVCPRDKWLENRARSEFSGIGVYILVGYKNEEDELPTIYIGQADGLRSRIDQHFQKKDFWDWCAIFVSTNYSLNRGHVTWLEYGLIERAHKAARSHLDNGNTPQEPALSAAEKADTKAVFGNVGSMLAFRLGQRDAEVIAHEFDEEIEPRQLTELSPFILYARTLEAGEPSQAYRMRTLPTGAERTGKGGNMITQSQMRFGRARDRVERSIKPVL